MTNRPSGFFVPSDETPEDTRPIPKTFFEQLLSPTYWDVAEVTWRIFDVRKSYSKKEPEKLLVDFAVRTYPAACETGFFGTVEDWLKQLHLARERYDRFQAGAHGRRP